MPSDEDIDEEMRRSRAGKYCNPVPRYQDTTGSNPYTSAREEQDTYRRNPGTTG